MSVETDMQAAEYVLGTLSAEERRAFEILLKSDASARRALEVWQQHLAPLSAAILGEVEPPAGVWQAIAQALSTSSEAAPDIHRLRRSRDRWRMATVLVSALAAGLAAFGIDRILVAPQEPQGSYVAVINRSGDQPALIVASISPRGQFSCAPSRLLCLKATASNSGTSARAAAKIDGAHRQGRADDPSAKGCAHREGEFRCHARTSRRRATWGRHRAGRLFRPIVQRVRCVCRARTIPRARAKAASMSRSVVSSSTASSAARSGARLREASRASRRRISSRTA